MSAARSVTVELDVPARMRDGTVLRANVYRPSGDGPWPTLLTRTPYGKDEPDVLAWLEPVHAAQQGFLVAIQDTRGRFASEGEWSPFRHEREDGHDSVEWAARLPGSNGRVGMFGDSYVGSTQWMAAVERPPSLGAIAPSHTWSEPLDGLLARGGALELGLALAWTLLYSGAAHLFRLGLSDEQLGQRVTMLLDDFDRLPDDGYWDLPVHDTAVLGRNELPDIGTISMLSDPGVADWSRVAGRHSQVEVPVFHTAAWHDVFVQGTLDNHMAMTALGRPSRLLVGPWTHTTFHDPIGELCFGIRGSRLGAPAHPHGDVNGEVLAWLGRRLVPGAAADDSDAPVRIFTMGRNEWRDEREWPLARARTQRWHLAAGGGLAPEAPAADAPPSEFVYDPADPVPTVGGPIVMSLAYPPGPMDQARVEARDDALVFTSEPLAEELEVTGRVKVVLHAESSAPSTDWVARLCDVHPDGRSFNVCDGVVRIAKGADALQRVEIDLWSTSIAFLRGHRLRVHVTSSSFPRWDRNLNTGDQSSARFESARQRVHHDADHASCIELPVIA
jgi:putative CocE/NonD family hydrolase